MLRTLSSARSRGASRFQDGRIQNLWLFSLQMRPAIYSFKHFWGEASPLKFSCRISCRVNMHICIFEQSATQIELQKGRIENLWLFLLQMRPAIYSFEHFWGVAASLKFSCRISCRVNIHISIFGLSAIQIELQGGVSKIFGHFRFRCVQRYMNLTIF